jgi:hypothetical protein
MDEEIRKVKKERSLDYDESPFDIAEERILNRIQKYPDVFPWFKCISLW